MPTIALPPNIVLFVALIMELACFVIFFLGHFATGGGNGLVSKDLSDLQRYTFGVGFIGFFSSIILAVGWGIGYESAPWSIVVFWLTSAVAALGTWLPRKHKGGTTQRERMAQLEAENAQLKAKADLAAAYEQTLQEELGATVQGRTVKFPAQ